jgi:outer membrane protein OmpA-like peptidoglycan-associated protein
MKTKRILLAAALMALVVGVAKAQDDTRDALKSYSFVEAQGGLQLTSTNAKMDKLMTPTAALSFGHFFSPVIGVRLHVNGWQSKSGFKSIDQYYKWNYITTDANLLVNLTNLFSRNHNYSHALNLILIGGFGLTDAWNNDELKTLINNQGLDMPLVWKKNRLSHNLRAGLRLETNVTKPLGLSLEVTANSLNDRFNSKLNNSDDWMFTAMLGLSFRFGHKYKTCKKQVVEPEPVPVPEPAPVVEEKKPEPAPVVEEKKPEPVFVEKNESLREEIFYVICKSDPSVGEEQIKRVVDFMKRNPNAKVSIVGYADKGTGTPLGNVGYSKQRAEKCKAELVEKYGCDASRITTDYKGDTVQPFSENDKNRCVIIEGKGSHQEKVMK